MVNAWKILVGVLALGLSLPASAGECTTGFCGTPLQSGGGGGGGGGSILVNMTDRGDTYQFADDFDGDGIEDDYDNCPFAPNVDQLDTDGDAAGDACDVCPAQNDPSQADFDGDGTGDACDPDLDNDGVTNGADNCPAIPNPSQANFDGDGQGDLCDLDDDNDGLPDLSDPCRLGSGTTACQNDEDGDGFPTYDGHDNCPSIYNPDQLDTDGDGVGDACDADRDGDGIPNASDNCPSVANPSQIDVDRDGLGDAGNFRGVAALESCDFKECYVVDGEAEACLSPDSAFAIGVEVVSGDASALRTGREVRLVLHTNRAEQLHTWIARFEERPSDSDVEIVNREGSGASPRLDSRIGGCARVENGGCAEENVLRFVPDEPGTYELRVEARLPGGDPSGLGVSAAIAALTLEIGGEGESGCAAAPSGIAAALVSIVALWRRRRIG